MSYKRSKDGDSAALFKYSCLVDRDVEVCGTLAFTSCTAAASTQLGAADSPRGYIVALIGYYTKA